jgi:uncharacterized protein YdbL (DUF1318 family)
MKPTRTQAQILDLAPVRLFATWLLAASFMAASFLASGAPARAQPSSDPVIAQARAAGQVGEQADGYVGVVTGQEASAEMRSHVEQLNIRRRTGFTTAANQRGVAVSDFAAAVACQFFGRIAPGERYRDENGVWRQRLASDPVHMPSFCGNG